MGEVFEGFFKVARLRANEKTLDESIANRSPSRSKKHRQIDAKSFEKSIDEMIVQTIDQDSKNGLDGSKKQSPGESERPAGAEKRRRTGQVERKNAVRTHA